MAFCCCSNATGAKVIAILSMVGSVAIICGFGGLAVYGSVKIDRMNHTEEVLYMTRGMYGDMFKNTSIEEYYFKNDLDLQKTIAYLGVNFNILYVFVGVYNLMASIELLQGVRQKNYWRCNAWLMWYMGAFIASIGAFLLMAIFVTENVLYKLVQAAIGWPIALYFMYIVYAFMNELEREDGKRIKN